MINVAIIVAYDGRDYFGWQKSASGPSIEGTLTMVLEKILQQKIILHAASRTDRGVHAEGQVVSCLIPQMNLSRLAFSANRLLPPSIRIYHIEEKPLDFHASCSVIKKSYQYKIYHHPICPPFLHERYWHLYQPLSVTMMREGASYLLGTHDFSSFSNRQENPEPQNKVCTLFSLTIEEESAESCIIEVIGNRFLYKMVRNIVGMLTYIGQGKLVPSELTAILVAKKRALAPFCSPAHGLTLKKVWYDWT